MTEQERMSIDPKDIVIVRFDDDTEQAELLQMVNRVSRKINEQEPNTPVLMLHKDIELETVSVDTLQEILDQAKKFQDEGNFNMSEAEETHQEQTERLIEEFGKENT